MKLSVAFALAGALPAFVHAQSTSTCTAITDPTPGTVCGQRGQNQASTPWAQQTLDLNTCVEFCADMNGQSFVKGCQTISHDRKNNLCSFFLETPSGLEFLKNSSSPTVFYSQQGCFDCTLDVCKASLDTNLFENAGFQMSKTLIGPWSETALGVVVPHAGPGNAVVFALDSIIQPTITLSQTRSLCLSHTYLISIDYKVDQITPTPPKASLSKTAFTLNFVDASFVQSHTADPTGCTTTRTMTLSDKEDGVWHNVQCSMNGRAPFNFAANAIASKKVGRIQWNVTFANAKLTGLPDGPIATTGPEFVSNGDFETGELAPWATDAESFGPYIPGYYGPAATCTDGQPLFRVDSPGLAAKAGTPTSRFKFSTCSRADHYFFYGSETQFALSQTPGMATAADTLYVFRMEYRLANLTLIRVSFGDVVFAKTHLVDGVDLSGATTVFELVFTGNGGVADLDLMFHSQTNNLPATQLSGSLDNISIRRLATP